MSGNFSTVPEGLHSLNYARNLLEENLGWPAKGNLELIADCITSVSKARRLTPKQAFLYIERAIRLAKEQHVKIDHFFFTNGDYLEMRPPQSDPTDRYEREKQLREQYEAHGCNSGWVYTGPGTVKRCPKCARPEK